MIHIDNDNLQFAEMLCAVLDRRQISWKSLGGEKTDQEGDGNIANYLARSILVIVVVTSKSLLAIKK